MRRSALLMLASGLLLWFLFQSLEFARFRFFNVDEYRYAHAGWLLSQGQVPYLDFWDHKFPFLYQLLSANFIFSGNDPLGFVNLRMVMFFLLLATLFSSYVINRRIDQKWALLAPLLMLSQRSFVFVAIEIQPDGLAVCLFFAAIAVLFSKEKFPWFMGFLSGLLFTLSVWTSQKVFCYGLVFPIAMGIDLLFNKRRKSCYLLGNPFSFALGSALVLGLILFYLLSNGILWHWFYWTIDYTLLKYHDAFPYYPRSRTLMFLLRDGWCLIMFAIFGLVRTWQSILKSGNGRWHHPDLLLLMAFPLCFLVWFLQRGAWLFSLLPFFTILAVFAARGLIGCLSFVACNTRHTARERKMMAVLALFLVMAHFFPAMGRSQLEPTPDNRYQRHILSEIGKITDPQDAVYDNSGSYITRPHAYGRYFTNAMIRRANADKLIHEVPVAILESRCTVFIADGRNRSLPKQLQAWLESHFRRYNKDIYLWGKKFNASVDGVIEGEFLANRDAEYYVRPASILDKGRLMIDDQLVTSVVFPLCRGNLKIRYEGPIGTSFEILWVPRNGNLSDGSFPVEPVDIPYGMVRYH